MFDFYTINIYRYKRYIEDSYIKYFNMLIAK